MYKIISKKELTGNIFLMEIEAPRVAKSAKPGQFIIVECKLENNFINISVKDTGKENLTLKTDKEIDEDDVLSEGGRGLFIISAYTDEAEFKDGCLIMKKSLK